MRVGEFETLLLLTLWNLRPSIWVTKGAGKKETGRERGIIASGHLETLFYLLSSPAGINFCVIVVCREFEYLVSAGECQVIEHEKTVMN